MKALIVGLLTCLVVDVFQYQRNQIAFKGNLAKAGENLLGDAGSKIGGRVRRLGEEANDVIGGSIKNLTEKAKKRKMKNPVVTPIDAAD